jgi:hypothetical protein
VTYSEAVVAPGLADFAVTGAATASNLVATSASVYTVEIEPTAQVRFESFRIVWNCFELF